HTRFSRDWSSDVCSSDLQTGFLKSSGCASSFPLTKNISKVLPLVLEEAVLPAFRTSLFPSGLWRTNLSSSANWWVKESLTPHNTDRKSVVQGKSVGVDGR